MCVCGCEHVGVVEGMWVCGYVGVSMWVWLRVCGHVGVLINYRLPALQSQEGRIYTQDTGARIGHKL